MRTFNWIRGIAVALATLGTTIPNAPAIAAGGDSAARPAYKSVNAKTLDIAMTNGTFKGRVVDHTGAPIEGAQVAIKQDTKELGRTLTDKNGAFAVNNLKSGVYTVASGNTEGSYRLWSENAAPPTAKPQGLLVMGENGARGNFGYGDDTGGWLLVGVGAVAIAAIIVGSIALSRANQANNRAPASP